MTLTMVSDAFLVVDRVREKTRKVTREEIKHFFLPAAMAGSAVPLVRGAKRDKRKTDFNPDRNNSNPNPKEQIRVWRKEQNGRSKSDRDSE